LCKDLFSVCSQHRHQPLIDRVLPRCTAPSTNSANVDCCSCIVQWCDVTGVCLYSVWVSVPQLGRFRPRFMCQTCLRGSVTRYIICGPSSTQFHHPGPRIFYILLITSHVLTPPWDTLVPHGPLHYTQNRRLADRRRKLQPGVHRYVVETVRDSLGPPSRVACHFPFYVSIFLTIFLPLLPYFSEFIYCSLNNMSKHFEQ